MTERIVAGLWYMLWEHQLRQTPTSGMYMKGRQGGATNPQSDYGGYSASVGGMVRGSEANREVCRGTA